MKSRIFSTFLMTCLLVAVALSVGCQPAQETDGASDEAVSVPHGYMARLEQVHDGRMIGFGPFVGYYFRPEDPQDLARLRFVCFNENKFYSSDMPAGAKLYEGWAVRTTLPEADIDIPTEDRINPVFFEDAPEAWRRSRFEHDALPIYSTKARRYGKPCRKRISISHREIGSTRSFSKMRPRHGADRVPNPGTFSSISTLATTERERCGPGTGSAMWPRPISPMTWGDGLKKTVPCIIWFKKARTGTSPELSNSTEDREKAIKRHEPVNP